MWFKVNGPKLEKHYKKPRKPSDRGKQPETLRRWKQVWQDTHTREMLSNGSLQLLGLEVISVNLYAADFQLFRHVCLRTRIRKTTTEWEWNWTTPEQAHCGTGLHEREARCTLDIISAEEKSIVHYRHMSELISAREGSGIPLPRVGVGTVQDKGQILPDPPKQAVNTVDNQKLSLLQVGSNKKWPFVI